STTPSRFDPSSRRATASPDSARSRGAGLGTNAGFPSIVWVSCPQDIFVKRLASIPVFERHLGFSFKAESVPKRCFHWSPMRAKVGGDPLGVSDAGTASPT